MYGSVVADSYNHNRNDKGAAMRGSQWIAYPLEAVLSELMSFGALLQPHHIIGAALNDATHTVNVRAGELLSAALGHGRFRHTYASVQYVAGLPTLHLMSYNNEAVTVTPKRRDEI